MAKKESVSHVEDRPLNRFMVVGIDPSMSSTAVTIHVFDQTGVDAPVLTRSDYLFVPSSGTQAKAFTKGLGDDTFHRMTNPYTSLHCSVESLDIEDSGMDVRIARYNQMSSIIQRFVAGVADFVSVENIYVSIEDYAMRANGMAYNIGEYGGILRTRMLNLPYRVIIRESDPLTVKLFAVNGNAQKPDMAKAYHDLKDANERATLCLDWFHEEYEAKQKSGKVKKMKPIEETSPYSDLIDSWWIAEVLCVELWVRWGWITQNNLEVRHLQVLNRVTKSYPVNVLNRPFLRK